MKEVKLIFPDNVTLTEFVLKQKVNHAEVDSREQTLTAVMPDDKIAVAESLYGAILKGMVPKN
jgi:hypothetical protein